MRKCEVCGRHPAKRMSFTAHQGMLIFRREQSFAGVFCRDHALAAYAAAQGLTLKGMWFSPGSLVFGTLQSLWDSAKLLDLPPEVKDAPWTPHLLGCPACGQEHFVPVGPVDCAKCGAQFVVVSCNICYAAQVLRTDSPADSLSTCCRSCGVGLKGLDLVRNWPKILIACAFAEVAARVGSDDGRISPSARQIHDNVIHGLFDFQPATVRWLDEYLDYCVQGDSDRRLKGCVANCEPVVREYLLAAGAAFAIANGSIDKADLGLLRALAKVLGFNPRDPYGVKGENEPAEADDGPDAWWLVLGIHQSASRAEVDVAFRSSAKTAHPDNWHDASPSAQKAAHERMKRLNAAYGRACAATDDGRFLPCPSSANVIPNVGSRC